MKNLISIIAGAIVCSGCVGSYGFIETSSVYTYPTSQIWYAPSPVYIYQSPVFRRCEPHRFYHH